MMFNYTSSKFSEVFFGDDGFPSSQGMACKIGSHLSTRFFSQELNPDLLHASSTVYQLSCLARGRVGKMGHHINTRCSSQELNPHLLPVCSTVYQLSCLANWLFPETRKSLASHTFTCSRAL